MSDTPNTLDVPRIIQHFGGTTQTWKLLKKNGVTVSLKTVESWGSRRSIPAVRLAQLVDVASTIGKPIAIETFLIRPTISH